MPRGPKWTPEQDEILTGMLRDYGDKPTNWSEEVKNMARARLNERSFSGIYQHALQLLKARNVEPTDNNPYHLATGA